MRIRTLLLGLILTSLVWADPVPRSEYDRNITITLRPFPKDSIDVLYRVEFDEQTLVTLVGDSRNGFPLDFSKTQSRQQFADAFVDRMKVVLPDQLLGTFNGKPIPWRVGATRVDFVDSVQFRFHLLGDLPFEVGVSHIEVEDLNFTEKKGKLLIKFELHKDFEIVEIQEPPERAPKGLDDPERRTAKASLKLASLSLAPEKPTPTNEPEAESPQDPVLGFWELFAKVRENGLKELFRSDIGLWVILALAFLHGAMHSLAPGHGKTMVAAYLVGEQGTPKHAMILGCIVTLTHTSAAFAVALLLKFVLTDTAPDKVQRTLEFVGGLTVACVGLWLLMARLRSRGHDHSHSHSHGHSHSHSDAGGHGHSHGVTPEQFGQLSWTRLILLGISGGVVPCWGAILWVLYCVTAGRFGLALYAVLAFSIGLAIILMLIGLMVVWSGRLGSRRFGESRWFQRIMTVLPIIGALMVTAIGLWLCAASLHETK